MLAHPPPFPLVVDSQDRGRDLIVGDEKGIIFELEQRRRVRRIRVWMNVSNLEKRHRGHRRGRPMFGVE